MAVNIEKDNWKQGEGRRWNDDGSAPFDVGNKSRERDPGPLPFSISRQDDFHVLEGVQPGPSSWNCIPYVTHGKNVLSGSR